MSDILYQIVAVKRQEVALADKRKSLELVRADAESRVLTRDFVGALRAKISAGKPAVIAEIKQASPSSVFAPNSSRLISRKATPSLARPACPC